MRCIVVLMSQSSSSATTQDLSVTSISNREPMLAGFPWVSAIILYTLSWGWSLLRPNTLYWDDWEWVFGHPPKDIWISTKLSGLAPWSRLIEWPLLLVGHWVIPLATFLGFFLTSIFVFGILKKVLNLEIQNLRSFVLLFLIVPVNHAKISIIVFDYTSSYLLFFLGWLILVRYRSFISFVFSWLVLFLSLKTHSLLFFVLLPFLHFVWLNKDEIKISKKLRVVHVQVFLIASLPINYLLLRKLFWPPTKDWTDYHQVTSAGLRVALLPIVIGLVPLGVIAMRKGKNLSVNFGLTLLVVGFLVTALALFPYFAGDLYVGYAGRPAYITVFEFRADWRSRHQLLMPLGLALSVVGLNELFNWRKKNFVFVATVALSVTLNMFWGSQYFLMSHKQEQLVELFATTKNKIEIASVEDDAMQFNGRGASFRSYEWNGFMTLAEISTGRPGCEALPSGTALVLKSNTPYLKALVTRDLGLYFEAKPCSEVLPENG
jgi:hypothetical protein